MSYAFREVASFTAVAVLVTSALTLGCARSAAQRSSTADVAVGASTQDRPFIVVVHAEWCAACRRVAPVIAWLRSEYGSRVTFIELDVTDESTVTQSALVAERFGLAAFFAANRETPGITIFGRDHTPIRHLTVESRPGPYRIAVEEALSTFAARVAP